MLVDSVPNRVGLPQAPGGLVVPGVSGRVGKDAGGDVSLS